MAQLMVLCGASVSPKSWSLNPLNGSVWFVPLVIGQGVTIYRAESLLMPMTLLLRRWGLWVQIGCVVIAVTLAIQFPESFFVDFMP